MGTTTIYGQYDACLRSNQPTTSQESIVGNIVGFSSTSDFHTCLKFDLSGFAPSTTIDLAKIRLYINGEGATYSSTLSVYRILRAWTEGATWNAYNGSNAWGTAGCENTSTDREAAAIGTLARGAADTGWHEITVTGSKIKELYDGTLTNNGFLLKDANSTSTPSAYYYETRDDFYSTGNLPELYLEYTEHATTFIPHTTIFFDRRLNWDWLKKDGLWQPQNPGLVTI